MTKASEFIKSSTTFTRLLYSFSVIKVTSKPEKNVNGCLQCLSQIENLIYSADLAEGFASNCDKT